jgi:hypothetical protein
VRTEPPRTDNVVARVKSPRRAWIRWPRIPARVAVILALALVAGSTLPPNRLARGMSLLLLCVLGIGWLIAWQARAGRRLSKSGRAMEDFWPNDEGLPPSS